AVGIVRVRHSQPVTTVSISGGETVQDARNVQFQTNISSVTGAVPQSGSWQGNWLIAQKQISLDIWSYAKKISDNFSFYLGMLLDNCFDIKQGDVNATLLNPLRLGPERGNFYAGDVAIYKGEDMKLYAPLPPSPSDWAKSPGSTSNREVAGIARVLENLKHIDGKQYGIVLRQVARLNTRERLIASWFERESKSPLAFTNELWRMMLKPDIAVENGKALLALLSSKTIVYLINLFSTNNHVSKDELVRVPIPDPQTLPIAQLSDLANRLLAVRGSLERDFVERYHAVLPEFEAGTVYIPPSTVLAASRVPKLTIQALVGRGEVRNTGQTNGRIRTLRTRNIVSTIGPSRAYATSFSEILNLFLYEPGREEETWSQAQNWTLPDPVASAQWLSSYRQLMQQAQQQWETFLALQQQVDEAIADWYGFDEPMRTAISQGLPWAQRRRV
ncbi:MAG TPA: hypothetical protein DHW02_16600, partial [Ktedonobacter sp.]|nr:hypothetical protein [Ktedonobacter sp.]